MSGTTAKGFPYPTDLDLVQNVDEAIQALAEAVDPLGFVGSAKVTANQGGIVGSADLTGLSVTFTAIAGHRYRIDAAAHMNSNADGNYTSIAIAEGGTTLAQGHARLWAGGWTTVRPLYVGTFSAGVHTVRAVAIFSGGTNQSNASATNPAWLVVEDLG